jgi:hypothetical protein
MINKLESYMPRVGEKLGSTVGSMIGKRAYGTEGADFGRKVGSNLGRGMAEWMGGQDLSEVAPRAITPIAPMVGSKVGNYFGNRAAGSFGANIGSQFGGTLATGASSYLNGVPLEQVARKTAYDLLPSIGQALSGPNQNFQSAPSYAAGGYAMRSPGRVSYVNPSNMLGISQFANTRFIPHQYARGGAVIDRMRGYGQTLSKYAPYIAPAVGVGIGYMMDKNNMHNRDMEFRDSLRGDPESESFFFPEG